MYPGSSNRGWNALSNNQKIAVAVVGLLVLYGIATATGGPLARLTDPGWLMAATAIVFIAFPIHEFAHAATAVALGDNTPRLQGRYTLNPLVHIDPIGAVLIFLFGFGWAKPVMWNPGNIDVNRRLGVILVAAAGPCSNLLLAVICILLYRFGLAQASLGESFVLSFVYINVLLFVFNLLPVPPLDGSHVLFALWPGDTYRLQAQLRQFGFLFLFAIFFMLPGLITTPTVMITRTLFNLFG